MLHWQHSVVVEFCSLAGLTLSDKTVMMASESRTINQKLTRVVPDLAHPLQLPNGQTIPCVGLDEAQRILGVHLPASLSMAEEEKVIQKKINFLCAAAEQCITNLHTFTVFYRSRIQPTIQYHGSVVAFSQICNRKLDMRVARCASRIARMALRISATPAAIATFLGIDLPSALNRAALCDRVIAQSRNTDALGHSTRNLWAAAAGFTKTNAQNRFIALGNFLCNPLFLPSAAQLKRRATAQLMGPADPPPLGFVLKATPEPAAQRAQSYIPVLGFLDEHRMIPLLGDAPPAHIPFRNRNPVSIATDGSPQRGRSVFLPLTTGFHKRIAELQALPDATLLQRLVSGRSDDFPFHIIALPPGGPSYCAEVAALAAASTLITETSSLRFVTDCKSWTSFHTKAQHQRARGRRSAPSGPARALATLTLLNEDARTQATQNHPWPGTQYEFIRAHTDAKDWRSVANRCADVLARTIDLAHPAIDISLISVLGDAYPGTSLFHNNHHVYGSPRMYMLEEYAKQSLRAWSISPTQGQVIATNPELGLQTIKRAWKISRANHKFAQLPEFLLRAMCHTLTGLSRFGQESALTTCSACKIREVAHTAHLFVCPRTRAFLDQEDDKLARALHSELDEDARHLTPAGLLLMDIFQTHTPAHLLPDASIPLDDGTDPDARFRPPWSPEDEHKATRIVAERLGILPMESWLAIRSHFAESSHKRVLSLIQTHLLETALRAWNIFLRGALSLD